MISFLLSLILAWTSGFMVAECCLLGTHSVLPTYLIHVIATFLGAGIGLGLSSLWLFVWLLIMGSTGEAFVIADLILHILLITATAIWIQRRHGHSTTHHHNTFIHFIKQWTVPQKIAFGLFIVILLAALVQEGFIILNLMHGGWDAMAIWNMRARYIYLGQAKWRNAFDPALAHTDYPLLIPLTVTRGWLYFGTISQVVPIFIGALFSISTVGLLITALISLRSLFAGIVAGVVLISTPLFLTQSAYQTADVPLCFYILATLILITFCFVYKTKSVLFLAGLCAGFGAWTKNEGLLFALIVTIVFLIQQLRLTRISSKNNSSAIRHSPIAATLIYVGGLLIVLCIIATFKLTLATPNDLIANQEGKTLTKLLSVPRYIQIANAIGNEVLKDFPWLLIIAGGLVFGGLHKPAKMQLVFVVLGVMMVGYFFVYVTTPMDLTWHLDTSLDRVMLHLWPDFLFASFYCMRLIHEQDSGVPL